MEKNPALFDTFKPFKEAFLEYNYQDHRQSTKDSFLVKVACY